MSTATQLATNEPPRRRRLPLLWLAVAAGVAVFAAAVFYVVTRVNPAAEARAEDNATTSRSTAPSWYDVTKRSFDLTVIASGELEAKRKVEIKSEVDGNVSIVEIVPEGTSIKAGDVLVRLTDDDVKNKVEQESLDTEKAKADKVAAEQALAIQENEAASALEQAELKLGMAQLDISKWQKGSDPQKRRELNLALEKAKRTLVQAQRDKELSKQLYDEKFISQGELEDDEIKAIEAESALATAELDIKVYEQFTRPKEEKQALADVAQATAELDRVKRKNQSDHERLQADLNSKARAHKIREERLAKLKVQLENTIIKMPNDGLVVYATSIGPAWRRQQPMAQGRQVRMGESIMILPDTRQMVAAIKVNEALISNVKNAQQVSVMIDAHGTTPVPGEVSQIAVTADDGGFMNPDLREYVVRVDLPPEVDTSLKPGMRCSGEILIGKVDDAIAVPVQAVFSESDQRFCYVQAALGKVSRKPVKLGRASESFVEVKEGLAAGDRVLLRRPQPGEVKG